MNVDAITITVHAYDQFRSRWSAAKPKDWNKEILRLLQDAKEEDHHSGLTVRLMQNNFRPARYFIAEGWRFVFDEELTTLITCERIIFKSRMPSRRALRNENRRRNRWSKKKAPR